MKIILIGPAHPLRGGLAAFNERMARALQEEGHEVEIYSFSLQYPGILFPGKTQYTDAPAPAGLKIFSRINSINPFNWGSVGREIKNKRPDLVITAYWMPFMARALGRIARIIRSNSHTKVIALVHNLVPHEKRFGDESFTKYFVRSVDGFVTLSKSVLEDIERYDNEKPKLFTPHPIYDHYGQKKNKEEAKRALGLDTSSRYILSFGFIRDYKGLDILLDAMGDERVRALGVKLIIAGEYYSDPKKYQDQIKKLGIEKNVIAHNDFIPENKVADYFSAADVVVQPYRTATQSGVTQIAYHFEKPMIVTDVGGLPEIVPDGKVGYVVKPDAGSLANAINDFFVLKKEEEFSRNAAEEKKRFGWDKLVEVMLKLKAMIR
jgi:glycosyltransferase involved in cell wall biosynthesis